MESGLRIIRLPLRVSLIGLPFYVIGYLGKLCLSIPWQHLGSKPAVIRLTDVFLIAGPTEFGKV